MRNALAIARKELGIYFTTPWAWVVLAAVLGLASFFFAAMLGEFQRVHEEAVRVGWAAMRPEALAYRNLTDGVVVQLWGVVMFTTLFVAPFLSMRLFAEELRQKTFELLMTTPVRPIEIVIGKYLGALGVISITLGLTIVFPLVLSIFGSGQSGSAVEWSTVLLGYAGLLLWGAACVAIGMFTSSLTQSQGVAAILTFAVLLPWWLLNLLLTKVGEPVRSVVSYLSFSSQLEPMMHGILKVQTPVFFLSIVILSIFLTHRRVEAFRWS